MNTIKLFLISLVVILSSHLHSQVTLEWVARFGYGPYTATYVDAMALDSAGNIIVAGADNQSPAGFSLIKFNSSGQLVWARRFSGGRTVVAQPKSIAVDPLGNIYIGAYDVTYIVLKYNSVGVLQWWRRYSGTGGGHSTLTDLVINGNIGVVVTGVAPFANQNSGCLTINCSQITGDSIWSRKYNVIPSRCEALDLGIHYSVTGKSSTVIIGHRDYLTLSYDQSGNLRWARTWNGPPGNRWDVAYDVASDRNGNVYVTGYSVMDSVTGNEDIATIKYDSSGNLKWVRFYDGTGIFQQQRGIFIKIDPFGDVIVVGYNTQNDYDYCTLKYDSLGNFQWAKIYNGLASREDMVKGLAVDKFGSVYVTGDAQDILNRPKLTTLKYDKNGNLIWIRKYPDSDTISAPTAIIVDKNLNVYVAGQIQIQNGGAALVLKYSQPLGTEPVSGIQPVRFKLYQNYPNPFNPMTKIRFDIPLKSFVKLTVYDALGKTVAVLVNQELEAGSYESSFSASELSSGVYFYQIDASSGNTEYKDTGKMLVIK